MRVFHTAGGTDSSVIEVYAYDEADVTVVTTDIAVAERAFRLFNVGDDPDFGLVDHRAREYRDRGNRSLSVGDIVAVDGRYYTCTASGWRPITPPPLVCTSQHGTTPLY